MSDYDELKKGDIQQTDNPQSEEVLNHSSETIFSEGDSDNLSEDDNPKNSVIDEAVKNDESGETTETSETVEDTEATDNTEAAEDTEVTEDTEVAEGNEATEDTEAAEDTETTEGTEAAEETVPTENTETADISEQARDDEQIVINNQKPVAVKAKMKLVSESEYSDYPKREPYHDRYYLKYGYEEEPENTDNSGTRDFLVKMGFGKGFLQMAREGRNLSERIAMAYPKSKSKVIYCDFCGVELTGTEYDILKDGRKRCNNCTRTAVKTEADFLKIYDDVIENFGLFFDIKFNKRIKIKMVNARELHKQLKLTFVPSAEKTARVSGVAIRDKKEGFKIFLENGSPRILSIQTLVHELTHIWQYENWDAKEILGTYGKAQNIEIYEGMAKWIEIQYQFLLGEFEAAKRDEFETCLRDDEYGKGFLKYATVHPISRGMVLEGSTPFDNIHRPL